MEDPEKNVLRKDKNQLPETQLTCHCGIFNSRIQIQATLVGGECSLCVNYWKELDKCHFAVLELGIKGTV